MVNPTSAFHPGYIAEATLFGVVASVLFIFFALQLLAERVHPEKVGIIHRPFHWCGFIGSLACIISSTDPQGIFGIFPWQVVNGLRDVSSDCVYVILLVWGESVMTILDEFSANKSSEGKCSYRKVYLSVGIFNIICILALTVVEFVTDKTFYRGISMLFASLTLLFTTFILLIMIFTFHLFHNKIDRNNTSSEKQGCFSDSGLFSPKTRKVRYSAAVFLAVGIAELQGGINSTRNPSSISGLLIPPFPMQYRGFFFNLLYWVAFSSALYSAWIPLAGVITAKATSQKTNPQKVSGSQGNQVEVNVNQIGPSPSP